MPNTYDSVLGLQWGDEGKGKYLDFILNYLYQGMISLVARWNGGTNAGHTIVRGNQKIALHGPPSGIISDVDCLIAPMCVVNIPTLLDTEIADLKKQGFGCERFHVANEAFTILPWHTAIEGFEEEALGKSKRDTTLRGIGPAYGDITRRYGIPIGVLMDPEELFKRVQENLAIKNMMDQFRDLNLNAEAVTAELLALGERIAPYTVEMDSYIESTLGNNGTMLFEGAQGSGLDYILSPSYPYVSSSGMTTSDIEKIFRVNPSDWRNIHGVMKAYVTSVGYRIFPTKQDNDIGGQMRQRGGEFGTTTGRPRDCGWLDLVMVRLAIKANRTTGIFITKLDVLDEMPEIKVCVAYRYRGDEIKYPPRAGLAGCKPIYTTFPGWQTSTRGVTQLDKLAKNARKYVDWIAEQLGIPLIGISTGPDTRDTIWLG